MSQWSKFAFKLLPGPGAAAVCASGVGESRLALALALAFGGEGPVCISHALRLSLNVDH